MSGSAGDRVPLLHAPPSPLPFDRNSSLRTSRRNKTGPFPRLTCQLPSNLGERLENRPPIPPRRPPDDDGRRSALNSIYGENFRQPVPRQKLSVPQFAEQQTEASKAVRKSQSFSGDQLERRESCRSEPSSPALTHKKLFSLSFMNRSSSQSPSRKGKTSHSGTTNRRDRLPTSVTSEVEATGTTMLLPGNSGSRSQTPSPNRAAVASPTTYRRVRHASDTPLQSHFIRWGSLPIHKNQQHGWQKPTEQASRRPWQSFRHHPASPPPGSLLGSSSRPTSPPPVLHSRMNGGLYLNSPTSVRKTFIKPAVRPADDRDDDVNTWQGMAADTNSSPDSYRISTDSSRSSVYSTEGMWACLTSAAIPPDTDKYSDHFSYLLANEEEYLRGLGDTVHLWHTSMNHQTPSYITQHFNLLFHQMEMLQQFHSEFLASLRHTEGNLAQVAWLLQNEQLQCYHRYMLLMPAAHKDLHRHSSHLNEHYPNLKGFITKPSMRLNFYVLILASLQDKASQEEKQALQFAIDYLNQLKRRANTEMSLKAVEGSPVDLRLGGELLVAGELSSLVSGHLQKRKYYLFLFQQLLVVTSNKIAFFKYKLHYRLEQLSWVRADGDTELSLTVLAEGLANSSTLRFKLKTKVQRDQWFNELRKVINHNVEPNLRRTELHEATSRCSSKLIPLNVYHLFPNLAKVLNCNDTPVQDASSPEIWCKDLINGEKDYIQQLSSLLNPDSSVPPKDLGSLLEEIYQLHNKSFLPSLERCCDITGILNAFNEKIDAFSIYSDYILVRCQKAGELDVGSTGGSRFITPVQHLSFYILKFWQLRFNKEYDQVATFLLEKMQLYVQQAQGNLIRRAIIRGRVDLCRSGQILRSDKMEVKTRKKELRDGSYMVILFEHTILLTKPRPPYYEYVWDIWLDQINPGPPTGSDTWFKLEVRQGGGREPVTYELGAATREVRREWLDCLNDLLINQVKKLRELITH